MYSLELLACLDLFFQGVSHWIAPFCFIQKLYPHSTPMCSTGTWQTGRASISPFICKAQTVSFSPTNSPGRMEGGGLKTPFPTNMRIWRSPSSLFPCKCQESIRLREQQGRASREKMENKCERGLFRASLIRPKMSPGQGTRSGGSINASAPSQEVQSDIKGQRLKPLSCCHLEL